MYTRHGLCGRTASVHRAQRCMGTKGGGGLLRAASAAAAATSFLLLFSSFILASASHMK